MTIILNVVLALAKGVPELDCPVARTGNDLPVIRAKANGQHIGGMANKAARGNTCVEVPKAEGVVPGGRECELAVRRDDNVGHEVIVAPKDALRVAVRILVTSELPDND